VSNLSDDTLSALERLTLRVNGINPSVRSKVTDSPELDYNTPDNPVKGLETTARNYRRRNTMASRKQGGSYPGRWKPDIEYLMSAPVTLPTQTPVFGGGHAEPGTRPSGNDAVDRANAESNGLRLLAVQRHNDAVTNGEPF
jgi:hypothetical protein